MNYKAACEICKNTSFPVRPLETVQKRIPRRRQTHTHEFTDSTELALRDARRHNHRFASVTSEAIPAGRSHIHKISVNTTFDVNHFHEVIVKTGLAQTVNPCAPKNEQRHIHFVEGETTLDGAVPHDHRIEFATLSAPNPPIH